MSSAIKLKIQITSFLALILFSSIISCASVEKQPDMARPSEQTEEEKEVRPVEIRQKRSITEDIIVRDIVTKETYPLSRIVMHGIVFIELSATWCKACPEMKAITTKLLGYFEGKVSFVRLYRSDDILPDHEYQDIIPEMEIVSSPAELGLENTEAMPRVIVLSDQSSEITADMTGVYPILYYYGLLSDL